MTAFKGAHESLSRASVFSDSEMVAEYQRK